MNIQKIVEEIKTQKNFANEIIEEGDPSTATFRAGRKTSAQESLARLASIYKENLRKNIVAIIVSGGDADAFTQKATELVEVPNLKYNQLITDISQTFLDAHLGGKTTTINVVTGINEALSQVYSELEIDPVYVEYKTSMDRVINTREELDEFIADSISREVGADLLALYVANRASQVALESLYDGNRFAFTVTATSGKEADQAHLAFSRISPNTRLVVAGRQSRGMETSPTSKVKEVTDDTVMETLNEVKNSINKGNDNNE